MSSLHVAGQVVHFGTSEDLSAVPAGSVRLTVTSPPYWNMKRYGDAEAEIGHESYEEFLDRLDTVWRECHRVAAEHSVLVVNVGNRRHNKRYYPLATDIAARLNAADYGDGTGWRQWDHVVWYIPNALPQPNFYRERLLDTKCEHLLVFTKDGSSDYTFHKPRVPQKYAGRDPRRHKMGRPWPLSR